MPAFGSTSRNRPCLSLAEYSFVKSSNFTHCDGVQNRIQARVHEQKVNQYVPGQTVVTRRTKEAHDKPIQNEWQGAYIRYSHQSAECHGGFSVSAAVARSPIRPRTHGTRPFISACSKYHLIVMHLNIPTGTSCRGILRMRFWRHVTLSDSRLLFQFSAELYNEHNAEYFNKNQR